MKKICDKGNKNTKYPIDAHCHWLSQKMLNIINAVVVVDGVCYAKKIYNCYIIYYLCLNSKVAETKPTKGRHRDG